MNKSSGAKPGLQSNKGNCHVFLAEIETLANNRKYNGKDKTKVRTKSSTNQNNIYISSASLREIRSS